MNSNNLMVKLIDILLYFSFEYDPKIADCSEANINHFRKFSEESKLNMVCFKYMIIVDICDLNVIFP
jgi:hypothetical protein